MTIHREGYKSIAIGAIIFVGVNIVMRLFFSVSMPWLSIVVFIITLGLFLFLVSFFRIPNRALTVSDSQIICPADGKVVVIEEMFDKEYFNEMRLQVSIFMSPADVHVNRNPIAGDVVYNKYHKGKYLVAWNPKSSTENERHSVVIKNGHKEILVKQIAGALAKRIVNYLEVGGMVKQTHEFGFIKFGSRVDLLLPIGTQLNVQLNDVVKGGVTVLGIL